MFESKINNSQIYFPIGFKVLDQDLEMPLDASMLDVINSVKGRLVTTKSPTLAKFAESKGFNVDEYNHFFLNSMCGKLFKGAGNYTVSRSNKVQADENKRDNLAQRYAEITAEYNELEKAGGIDVRHSYEPLNLSRKQDRAYIRILARRQKQKADRAQLVQEGETDQGQLALF